LAPLIPVTKLGLAGPLGSGTQHWPWISLHDEAAAIVHLLTSNLAGPVNLVGPTPATANEVMKALADALHRPYLLPVPSKLITLALQDAGRDLLLADQRVSAARLESDGFTFTHRAARDAIAWMLSDS
jgi:NAD dependent epimerase/dehydratase family enzyme